jgi:hypothetical protein
MDDPANTHLTGQFGHSSQELINLLLTGVATSNTFDNTVTLGSLKCHGIQSQPSIGYLTQLEALRYCSVGSYYKSPEFPIWIVGSTSHFTVMFGSMDSLKESESDTLLENCRRAFKSVENAEENGFILVNELGTVMAKLDLSLGAGLQTLAAALEMSGSGIILWSDFWKVVSRLKTGASLESVLNTDVSTHQHNEVTSMTTTQYDGSIPGAVESDEALAKRLAAEWGSGDVEKSMKKWPENCRHSLNQRIKVTLLLMKFRLQSRHKHQRPIIKMVGRGVPRWTWKHITAMHFNCITTTVFGVVSLQRLM